MKEKWLPFKNMCQIDLIFYVQIVKVLLWGYSKILHHWWSVIKKSPSCSLVVYSSGSILNLLLMSPAPAASLLDSG